MLNVYLMKYLAVGAIVLMIGMAIYEYGHTNGYKEKEVELLSCQNTVITMNLAATTATTESYIKRDQAIKKNEERENALKTDIDALAAAYQRLQLSAVQASGGVQRASATAKGGKAGTTSDMCPVMLSKCDQTIRGISENLGRLSEFAPIADKARNAGLTCEAAR